MNAIRIYPASEHESEPESENSKHTNSTKKLTRI